MYLQNKNPDAWKPDLGTSCLGGTLTYQSRKIPSVPSPPHRFQAHRQERTWSKRGDVVYRSVSDNGLRKATEEGF